jgi:hypothetical protein
MINPEDLNPLYNGDPNLVSHGPIEKCFRRSGSVKHSLVLGTLSKWIQLSRLHRVVDRDA